jgi:hypothetical protein
MPTPIEKIDNYLLLDCLKEMDFEVKFQSPFFFKLKCNRQSNCD